MLLDHQEDDLALKLPVITDKYGLRFFMSIISFSKLDKNKSKLSFLVKGTVNYRYNHFFIVVTQL